MGEQLWGGGDVSSGFRMLSMNSKPSHSGRFLIYWAYICLESDFFFLNSSLIVIVAGRFLLLFATSVSLRPPPNHKQHCCLENTIVAFYHLSIDVFWFKHTTHAAKSMQAALEGTHTGFCGICPPPLPFKKWGLKSWNSATSNKIPANHIECVGKR